VKLRDLAMSGPDAQLPETVYRLPQDRVTPSTRVHIRPSEEEQDRPSVTALLYSK